MLVEVNNCLKQLNHNDLTEYEHKQIMRRLRQLIAQYWHTDEIPKHRPPPVDEARWGFAVVENSLWEGVPRYLRELNEQLENVFGYKLPVENVPVTFTSWMGGDRDGNPSVTADITRRLLLLSRWKAIDLFMRDIQVLVSELSMGECPRAACTSQRRRSGAKALSTPNEAASRAAAQYPGLAGGAATW